MFNLFFIFTTYYKHKVFNNVKNNYELKFLTTTNRRNQRYFIALLQDRFRIAVLGIDRNHQTDELEAVMLGLRWVMRRGDSALARAAQDAVAKVGAVLPRDMKPVLFDASLLVPTSWRNVTDSIDMAIFRRAIREQRKVLVRYSAEDGAASERVIWPIAISYFETQRLVIAWCELRQDFRTFRADRILKADMQQDKYQERRKVLLKRWMDQEKAAGHEIQSAVFM